MAYKQLRYTPGVVREVTEYGSGGSQSPPWWNTDMVRFRFGYPEKIGGWVKTAPKKVIGHIRSLFSWSLLNGDQLVAIGSEQTVNILTVYGIYDITPIKTVHPLAAGELSGIVGTTFLIISWVSHGLLPGELITIQNPGNAPGPLIPPMTPTEAQIQGVWAVVDSTGMAGVTAPADQVVVNIKSPEGAPYTPNFPYNDPFGLNTTVIRVYSGYTPEIPGPSLGWGSGPWGGGGWGQTINPSPDLTVRDPIRRVSFDNFGQQLIGCRRMGPIAIWDPSYGYDLNGWGELGRAVQLGSLPGANMVPDVALEVMVSEQIRTVLAFGVKPIGGLEIDPMLFRWCDRENYLEWEPKTTNSAGELRLSGGSRFVTAAQTRREILAWTDRSLCSIQFIGGDNIFGMDVIARGITIAGPGAKVVVGDEVYWMGLESFYKYSGQVTALKCPLQEMVFSQLNYENAWKTSAAYEPAFGEIKFFYCEGDDTEPNNYVLINLHDQSWAMGKLTRTAWLHSARNAHSIGASIDDTDYEGGYLYTHEVGADDGSTVPPKAIKAFATSTPIELGAGDSFMFVNRMIPDVTFRLFEVDKTVHPKVRFVLEAFDFPGSAIDASDNTSLVARSTLSTVDVEQFTKMTYPRLRGRSMRLTISSSDLGVSWRMGTPRVDIRTDGKRA